MRIRLVVAPTVALVSVPAAGRPSAPPVTSAFLSVIAQPSAPLPVAPAFLSMIAPSAPPFAPASLPTAGQPSAIVRSRMIADEEISYVNRFDAH